MYGRTHARLGLSLIELLVALAIIGVIVALVLPAVAASRERARAMQCLSNLRQIGAALHQYHDVFRMLPQGRTSITSPFGMNGRSVHVALLPYLDGTSLFESLNDRVLTYLSPANHTVELRVPGVFVCPSDSESPVRRGGPGALLPAPDPPGGRWSVGVTQYGMMFGFYLAGYHHHITPHPTADPLGVLNGCFNDLASIKFSDVTDGQATTIFASERALGHLNSDVERSGAVGRWISSRLPHTLLLPTNPPNAMFQLSRSEIERQAGVLLTVPSSYHPGGVHVLMGDGAARFVAETIDSWGPNPSDIPCQAPPCNARIGLWQSLASRNGGEVIRDW